MDEAKNTADERKWISTESMSCFNFTHLVKKVKRGLKSKYPDKSAEEIQDLTGKSLDNFKINDQAFEFHTMPNNFGGVRWYVKCPSCGVPCTKLYFPTTHKDREKRYLCKICHKLKNASLLMGGSKKYKKVVRPLKQLERIRSELMRKNMTPDRAKPLLDEYERLERELSSSSEYRLWKFQKQHGDQP